MDFLEKLDILMSRKGLNKNTLSKACDIPYTTIDGWYKKGYDNLRLPTLKKLASFFQVSLDSFVDDSDIPLIKLSPEQNEILRDYDYLNQLGQTEARKRIHELCYVPDYHEKKLPIIAEENNTEVCEDSCNFITLKHYLNTASAGTGSFLFDTLEETLSVKDTETARKADFVIKVSGDSMEPLYQDGDIVLVKSLPKIQIDEIGIFVKDGETFIKRLGKNCLISENKNYTSIVINDKESVSCYGKVLGKAEIVS